MAGNRGRNARVKLYVIHLDPPVGHARHYTGTTTAARLKQRLAEELAGNADAARLLQVAVERGVSLTVALVLDAEQWQEGWIKDVIHAPAICPLCGGSGRLPRKRGPKGYTRRPRVRRVRQTGACLQMETTEGSTDT